MSHCFCLQRPSHGQDVWWVFTRAKESVNTTACQLSSLNETKVWGSVCCLGWSLSRLRITTVFSSSKACVCVRSWIFVCFYDLIYILLNLTIKHNLSLIQTFIKITAISGIRLKFQAQRLSDIIHRAQKEKRTGGQVAKCRGPSRRQIWAVRDSSRGSNVHQR